jgi:hypothetical protein
MLFWKKNLQQCGGAQLYAKLPEKQFGATRPTQAARISAGGGLELNQDAGCFTLLELENREYVS